MIENRHPKIHAPITLDSRHRSRLNFCVSQLGELMQSFKEERMFVLYLSIGKVTMHQAILHHESLNVLGQFDSKMCVEGLTSMK